MLSSGSLNLFAQSFSWTVQFHSASYVSYQMFKEGKYQNTKEHYSLPYGAVTA